MNETLNEQDDKQALLRKSKILWAGVVAFLAVQVLLCVFAVFLAVGDRKQAIIPEYYKRSTMWDAHVELVRNSQQLAWRIEPIFSSPDPTGLRTMTVRLTDNTGQPIENVAIDLVYFAHVRAADEHVASGAPQDEHTPGLYILPIRMQRDGVWTFRFTISRPGEDTPLFYDEQHFITKDWRGASLSNY